MRQLQKIRISIALIVALSFSQIFAPFLIFDRWNREGYLLYFIEASRAERTLFIVIFFIIHRSQGMVVPQNAKGKIDDTKATSNFHLNETTFTVGVSIRSFPSRRRLGLSETLSNFRPKFNCLLLAFYLNSSLTVANVSPAVNLADKIVVSSVFSCSITTYRIHSMD